MSRPEGNGTNSATPDVAATETRGDVRGSVWLQLPLLLGLVVLWTVLWGQLTWLSVITGFLVALIVTRVFYLPPADLSGRLNLWYTLVFFARFIVDVTVASFTVAIQALNPRPIPPSSMIAVQLHTRSDFIITLNAIATSLVPGSLVVEVDRERAILYFHAFDTQTADDVEATRQHVLAVESRIVRAIGSKEDLVRIQETEVAP